MRRPSPDALRSLLFAAVGLIVGILVGIAAVGRFDDPGWFEAAGVWAGAAATVGAIVWAVNTFTWEQAEARRRDERDRVEAESQRRATARLVISRVLGGSSQGGEGKWEMREVQIELINTTSALIVSDIEVTIPGSTRVLYRLDLLKAGDTSRSTHDVDHFPVTDAQAVGGAPLGLVALIRYTLDGRRWSRLGESDPEPLTTA